MSHARVAIAAAVLALLCSACTCGGEPCVDQECLTGECHGEVWIQAYTDVAGSYDIAVTTFAPICNDTAVMTVEFGGEFAYLEADPEPGHTVVYTVVSEGPLKDLTVTCTVDPLGIQLTYVRAGITAMGTFECGCGFTEYLSQDGADPCG